MYQSPYFFFTAKIIFPRVIKLYFSTKRTDWIAIILVPISYSLLIVGVALAWETYAC